MYCNSPIAVTQHFIRTHMEQRNLEEAVSCLSDAVEWFGTGAFEIVRGKSEARRFLAEEISAFPSGYTIAFEDMTETLLREDVGTAFGRVLVTDHAMGSQLDCRVTTTCVQCEGRFLIADLHMSVPTNLQSDSEYYPLTIAAQKIQRLKDSFFNVTVPGGLICCEADGGFQLRYVNDFFVKLLGYQNKDDFLAATGGLFANCLWAAEDVANMESSVQAMEINGNSTSTYRVKTKEGGAVWLRDYRHKYESEGSAGLLCFCMDISDRIQLENELSEQKNELEFANAEIQTIISNIPGGVHRCPLFGTIRVDYVSHGFEKMSGYTQEEIHGLFHDNYSMMLVEEDRGAFGDAIRHLAVTPAEQNLEYRLRRKDGTVIRVADHFRSVRMEDGKTWGFGVTTDITAQYETLAQLQLLTDSIPGGLAVYESSAEGLKMVYFSDGVCEMAGYTREEYAQIVKTDLMGMVFEEDLAMLRGKIGDVSADSPAVDCVYRLRTKSGGYRWMNLRGIAADCRADVIHINVVLLDITDSKEAEEKLRIRDEEYSLAIQHSGKVVYRYTLADQSIHMLQKSIDLFDFPAFASNVPESIIEQNLIAPESVNDFAAFYESISKGEKSGCVTLRRRMKDGKFGWCRTHFTALFNSVGAPVSAVISIEDVTKQHEQELENEALRQNEALFQAVVAHSDRFIVKFDIQTQTAYMQARTAAAFCVDTVLRDIPYGCVAQGGIAEESVQIYIDFYEQLMRGAPSAKATVKMRRNGQRDQWGWYRFDGSMIFDDKKQPIYAVVSFVEVTEQYEKELAYERMNQHVNCLSKDAMLYIEANLTEMKIERAGGRGLCDVPYCLDGEPTMLLKTAIADMLYPEDQEDIRRFFDQDRLLAEFAAGRTEQETEVRMLQSGQPKWVHITIEMVMDPYTENILVYVLFRDIDQTKTQEMKILKQAETDGLTDLYNRTTIEREIKQALKTGRDEVYAFMMIDVDDLKTVNDTLGHMQGDRAIRAFADMLRSCLGTQALIGRIGGDEFLAFLRDAGGEEKLKEIAQALVRSLSTLRTGENNTYFLHGSIGAVINRSGEDDFETLYQKADTALYYVKRHGKDSCAIYSPDMGGLNYSNSGPDCE